jgi:hypothetical protein
MAETHMAETRRRGDSQQTVNLNNETHMLVDRLREIYERKLAALDVPVDLSKAKVINMAVRNELKREDAASGTEAEGARPPNSGLHAP